MNYTIYSSATGEVLRTGSQPDEHMEFLQLAGGELLVEGEAPPDTYVQEGLFVPRSPRPHRFCLWDWSTKQWLPSLDAAREGVKQQWNCWRDQTLSAGHNGYHSDDTFLSEIQLVLKGYERGHLPAESLTSIRKMDNTVEQMTWAQIESLALQLGLYRQSVYQQSWAGKDALVLMSTLEEIIAGGPPVS